MEDLENVLPAGQWQMHATVLVLHFPALRFGLSFSTSCIFEVLLFCVPSFSDPVNSASQVLQRAIQYFFCFRKSVVKSYGKPDGCTDCLSDVRTSVAQVNRRLY